MNYIGIIGGSGLDNPEILQNPQDIKIETPYGETSSLLKKGKISGKNVILLARHGREHTIPPTQINNRANIWALKEIGCDQIIATTAVGSLQEKIDRGHFVILDQFIDFTRRRKLSFFSEFKGGEMKHTPMAEPFDEDLRNHILQSTNKLNITHHPKGTVITIEGPRFSTKAESFMFKSWGADVINMSTAPECILANEIEIPYAAIALSTDYDCWKDNEETVSWEAVIKEFNKNIINMTNLLIHIIKNI